MTLRLPAALLEEIRHQGEQAYPAECCGAIAGRAGFVKHAVRLFPVPNRRQDDPHRYLIGPEDIRDIERALRGSGWEIVGYYHSHPGHPAAPSAFDTAQAWPWYSYVIVRVDAGRSSDLRCWVLDPERPVMHPEPLEVLTEV